MSEKDMSSKAEPPLSVVTTLNKALPSPRWESVNESDKLERGVSRGLALRPIVSGSKEMMATDLSVAGLLPEGALLEDVNAGVYGRFSKARKRGIIGMVAMTSIITREFWSPKRADKQHSLRLSSFLPYL